jgi:hypothetical protein
MSNRGIIYRASLILYNCAMTAPFLRALSLTPEALDYMKAIKKECVPPLSPRARVRATRAQGRTGGRGAPTTDANTGGKNWLARQQPPSLALARARAKKKPAAAAHQRCTCGRE